MSEHLGAIVVAAGRSQRMGFDKLLTPIAGRPLLLHTLGRLLQTGVPHEVVLVIRPGSEAEMSAVIAPLRDQGSIRLVSGGEQRQDSVRAGLKAMTSSSQYVLIHDAARPFLTRELVEVVLEAAKTTGAAVCGTPCSDSLKEVNDESLVQRTIDRSRLWNVQTPQIFNTVLLRDAYQAVAKLGGTFTDDTAVVERAGYPVQTVLYQGVNLKVTTPADWALAEAYLRLGDTTSGVGPEIRKHLHDLNNHLTPLLGYAYLLANEFPEDSRSKKFAAAIQGAGERCQVTAAAMQKIIREVFPRKDEKPVANPPS
jgi:2-C-methyl-D-erythritol 4-phosphate cytidylyltransferase